MRKFILLIVGISILTNCSKDDNTIVNNIVYGDPVEYEGKTYKTFVIGGQIWFAENLNDGHLYDWATAMNLPAKCNTTSIESDPDCALNTPHRGICPANYHIPEYYEWNELKSYVCDDTVGFSDMLGYWWSSTEYISNRASCTGSCGALQPVSVKSEGLSVRCVKD